MSHEVKSQENPLRDVQKYRTICFKGGLGLRQSATLRWAKGRLERAGE